MDHVKELLGVGAETRQVRVQALAAVHGLPGIGKTTLANRLSHDPEVHATFADGVLWGAIGPLPNLLARVAGWGNVLGSQEMLGAGMLRQALEALRQLLRGKRMLVVLDDVWEVEHATPIIDACGADCALLVTTRAPGVVDGLEVPAHAVSKVAPLSPDQALELLELLAPTVVQAHPEACARLVAELECLPLAVHVAGGLLRAEERMGWGVEELLDELGTSTALLWAKAPRDAVDHDTPALPTVAALVERSVERLPPELKIAFMGLGAFSAQPAVFSLDELRVVLSELRVVEMMDDPRPVLRGLVSRGLVEPQGAGSFQIHPLLSMYARSLLGG
ncbi:NB-ARC domain-containing protein [Longimicrobium sp.]|uniref:NB-ARC domain-containing protein n=1 Tax=Longimicrobium sp. TaxID=2029185 RepID=UPI002E33C63D|nr:NB-ARC domain-containing protein [Longimicrobium sp.]HEX6037691.1 NB-ARC domain-containing protein [Longimicrobium sp.]